MAGGRAAAWGHEKQQAGAAELPVWLTLQRCRGVGWLHASRGGCLGLADSGRGAAVFSRVVLVPPEDAVDSVTSSAAVPSGTKGSTPASSPESYAASPPFARKRSAVADATLHALDKVAAVEVEAGAEEAALEGGYGDGGGLFAALLSPSVPSQEKRNNDANVEGEFLVMHHVPEETPQSEDAVEELHLCFGELLWHPTPPRLFACRSLWSSAQHMRLTMTSEEEEMKAATAATKTAVATAAASADAAAASDAAADSRVFVLTDVEETHGDGQDDAAAFPLVALRNMREALADREAFRRAMKDTISLSASSIRHSPETFAGLANAATEVLSKASADWVALGAAAFHAAAAAGGKIQRFWKDFSSGRGSNESSRGNEPAS